MGPVDLGGPFKRKSGPFWGPLPDVVGPCYGRLGACDGGGVKPGKAGGTLAVGSGRSGRKGLCWCVHELQAVGALKSKRVISNDQYYAHGLPSTRSAQPMIAP